MRRGSLEQGDLECIQLDFPERSIPIQPALQLLETARIDRVDPALCLRAYLNQPCMPQSAQVLGDSGGCHVEARRDLAGCAWAPLQHVQNAPTYRVRDRSKGVHRS